MAIKALVVVLVTAVAATDSALNQAGVPSATAQPSATELRGASSAGSPGATERSSDVGSKDGTSPHEQTAENEGHGDGGDARVTEQCSDEDQSKIESLGGGNAAGSAPKIAMDCAMKAFSFTGFDEEAMKQCIEKEMGVTSACADCFGGYGEKVAGNCVIYCLNWCSQRCLDCAAQHAGKEFEDCLGFDPPKATPC